MPAKSLSPLLAGVILVSLTVVLATLSASFIGSLSQSQAEQAKKGSSSLCTGSVKVSGISCHAVPPSLTNFSVILLRFNEGSGNIAKDEAGYDNNATVNAFWTEGKFSHALKFNESDSYANVSSFLSPNETAIELWVKPE